MYEIIIKKIEHKQVQKHEYQKTADQGNKNGGPCYGYVEIPGQHREVVEIICYKQTFDELDISNVAVFINSGTVPQTKA